MTQQPLKLWHGTLQGGRYIVHVWAYTAEEAAIIACEKYDEALEDDEDYQELYSCSTKDFKEITPDSGGGTFHFSR